MILGQAIDLLRKKIEFYRSQKQYEKAIVLNDACIELLMFYIEELENKTIFSDWKKYQVTQAPDITTDSFNNEINNNA